MKNFKYIALSLVTALALTSCNDYLDKLPDDRAEVNTESKVNDLLVSAYPSCVNCLVNEMCTDNVTDNGRSYSTSVLKDELYRFGDITDESNDSPTYLWQVYYASVATANQALLAIEEMGVTETLKAQVAEAKLIRAYSMLQLATTFCMAWNPEKADEYLGLPYPTVPEKSVHNQYERGTLRELYAKINQDIEEALPDVSDTYYTVPKYHFNVKAAYALAARFNLYYMNYEKCVEYASKVLGDAPMSVMRDWAPYEEQAGYDFIGNRYIKTSESANLMLIAAYSVAGRYLCGGSGPRFYHNSAMCSYETVWANAPWGSGSDDNPLYYSNMCYGSNQYVIFPKMIEQFEYTDKVNGTGYPHVVETAFTGDETVLCRAEAYTMLKQYDKAITDMNYWETTHCRDNDKYTRITLNIDSINSFIEGLDYAPATPETNRDRSMRKQFNPQGFTVSKGTQENLLQTILQMRRLETLYQGLRFYDLKRYGISFTHPISGEDAVVFKAGDLRGAVQLPSDVLQAGLTANPR